MSFADDLFAGEEAEDFVAGALLAARPSYTYKGKSPKGCKGYDLRFGRPMRPDAFVEVKRDRKAHKTGRVFIETACSGEPSGLFATEASTWVYLLDRVGVFRVAPKKLIDLCCARGIFVDAAGDGGRAKGYLLPVEVLIRDAVEMVPF